MMAIVRLLALILCGVSSTCGASAVSSEPSLAACRAALSASPTDLPAMAGPGAAQRRALLTAGGGLGKLDGGSYYAAWFPDGYFTGPAHRVLVTLHGTGGYPEAEWNDWHDHLAARGWGFVAISWLDPGSGQYADNETVHTRLMAALDAVDASCGVPAAHVGLAGFSRGSAEGFSQVVLDARDRHLLHGSLHISGAWPPDGGAPLPPVLRDLDSAAFTGRRLWLYCGALDRERGWPMCDAMINAQSFVATHGGTAQVYRDETGGHHGLYAKPEVVAQALGFLEALP